MNVNEVLDSIEIRALDGCAAILKEKYDINIRNEYGEYKTALELLEELEEKRNV